MAKFVMATYLLDEADKSDKIKSVISSTFNQNQDVVVLDLSKIDKEVLEKFVNMGAIDCFTFTPETLYESESRRIVANVLLTDVRLKKNTQFLNIYDGNNDEDVKKSHIVGDLLLHEDYRANLSQFNIQTDGKILSQNLMGLKNASIKQRELLQEKDEYIFNLTEQIVDKIELEKDEYTSKHIRSVCLIAQAIANKMGLSEEEIEILKIGSLLHDVGKQDIADSILKKPSRLTGEEFSKMKEHVLLGEVEMNNFDLGDFERAKNIVAQHHERFDGTGYPRHLKGEDIDILSRVVSLADAAQAMFGRSYQTGRTKDEIIAEIKKSAGTQFDPKIVGYLCDILQNEPQIIHVNYDKNGNIIYDAPTTKELVEDKATVANRRNNPESPNI